MKGQRYETFIDYLHSNNIIYNTYPNVSFKQYITPDGSDFFYGVELFKNKFKKISNSRQLFAIACTLVYINDHINWDTDKISSLLFKIGKEEWRACTSSFSDGKILSMSEDIEYLYRDDSLKPLQSKKKIIFGSGYTKAERLNIIKKEFPRKVYTEELIHSAYEELIDSQDDIISYSMLADKCKCSERTIKRNISPSTKYDISEYNASSRYSQRFNRLKEAMDDLINSGEKKVRVRRLKEITSIKDYDLIKEVISCFE